MTKFHPEKNPFILFGCWILILNLWLLDFDSEFMVAYFVILNVIQTTRKGIRSKNEKI